MEHQKHIKTINDRIDYLSSRIGNCSSAADNYRRAELAALRWAIGMLIHTGVSSPKGD